MFCETGDSWVSLQTGQEPASPCPSKRDKIFLKISHQDRPPIPPRAQRQLAGQIYLTVNLQFQKSEDAFQRDWERAALTTNSLENVFFCKPGLSFPIRKYSFNPSL